MITVFSPPPLLPRRARCRRLRLCGFTLTELLVAMGLIAILITVLMPALRRTMRSALEKQDMGNLRTLGLAHAQYMADHQMEVAPGQNPTNGKFWFYQALRPYLHLPLDTTTVAKPMVSPLDPSRGGEKTLSPIHRRSYAVNRRMLKTDNRTPIRVTELASPSEVFYLVHFNIAALHTNWCEPDAAKMKHLPVDWMEGGRIHVLFLDGHIEPMQRTELMPGGNRFSAFGPTL